MTARTGSSVKRVTACAPNQARDDPNFTVPALLVWWPPVAILGSSVGDRLPLTMAVGSPAQPNPAEALGWTPSTPNNLWSTSRHNRRVMMTYGNATIVDDLRSLELSEPGADAAAVYDRAIGVRLLYQDAESGQEHYLIRYPAGVKGRLHRHSAAHTIVVLDGRLEANGRVIGPGAYAHFPGGEVMRHQATADEPCLFVILFHAPFDVQIVQTELEP